LALRHILAKVLLFTATTD